MQNDKMDAKAERQEFVKRQEFERLVRENQSGLLAFLLSLTGNLPDSEDLVQECVTLLWRKFDEFESGSNFGAWARTTAFFLFRNQIRKASNKTMTFEANVLEKLAMAHDQIETEGSTRQQFLSQCLAELKEKDRDLILSRYETGVKVNELATQASGNVKSVYNALARIRKSLARCVRRKISGEEGGSA